MWKQLGTAFRLVVVMTVLTGLLYPGLIMALCQLLLATQANGSLILVHGRVVGSSLIGQSFSKPQYFYPRPSAAGNGYDASDSSGSNYAPTNQKLIDRVKASIAAFRRANPNYHGSVPSDLVTASASGLDPDISPASAEAQIARVAVARGIPVEKMREVVAKHTRGREFGFLGDPRVNVLEINLALDRQFPPR
jgi:K+-transporting ATPase ATPase C chain